MSLQMIFLKGKNEHRVLQITGTELLTWLKFFYIWEKLFYTK